ncbi:MAG: hypothetical protein U0838_10560 [Chloroflexota bacterium]
MSFLRRVFGGGGDGGSGKGEPIDAAAADREDAERDRALLREEAERTADDLIQRQMRYADRSWTPPSQGGTRRADDKGADES